MQSKEKAKGRLVKNERRSSNEHSRPRMSRQASLPSRPQQTRRSGETGEKDSARTEPAVHVAPHGSQRATAHVPQTHSTRPSCASTTPTRTPNQILHTLFSCWSCTAWISNVRVDVGVGFRKVVCVTGAYYTWVIKGGLLAFVCVRMR